MGRVLWDFCCGRCRSNGGVVGAGVGGWCWEECGLWSLGTMMGCDGDCVGGSGSGPVWVVGDRMGECVFEGVSGNEVGGWLHD